MSNSSAEQPDKKIQSGESTLTVLTCQGEGRNATKEFLMRKDGAIEKRSFNAGKFFVHEQRQVSCLDDLGNALDDLLDCSRKFIIRGAPKRSAGNIVRRKVHQPGAAFDPIPRPYVMLDIDKQRYPAHFDPVQSPETIIKWAREMLPAPFRAVRCYYSFSSSQNVPERAGGKSAEVMSVHLWFWCNRPVADEEWKRFFDANPAPVDQALFSAVQPHYTARPIFRGMADPLPCRSGFINGDEDVVRVPDIPAPKERKTKPRVEKGQDITQENRDKVLDLMLRYYEAGKRHRFAGAVAGSLYRGGWNSENTADFIYDLAEKASDEEASARYDSALEICNAIDQDRRAQGIPTLRDEFHVTNLDEILKLLNIGRPDIKGAIGKLLGSSDVKDIYDVINMLVEIPEAEQEHYLDQIKLVTKQSKKALNGMLKEAQKQGGAAPPIDWPDITMEHLLDDRFQSGRTLLRASDSRYWRYNGRYWEPTPNDLIKKEMLPYARENARASEGAREVSGLLNGAMNILEGRVYRENDPLHVLDSNVPAVINCLNGELWFDDAGDVTLKPHLAESYLKHCLNVSYDPSATSPLFEKAVLGIFAKSAEPEEMFRHFMELAGYICQPWRKHAIIVLLYGGGNNGKTSLMNIIIRILGEKMVMSDRISEFETDRFKIGALDGKLMLLDDDVDEGTCLPDGFLKKISEEKIMTGQHKYKPPFEFTCRAVPVMLANAFPAIKDLSDGIRRRIKVIPFSRKFESHEVNVNLVEEIWEKEAAGVLNQVVAGFQRLKKRDKFKEPPDCIHAKNQWLTRSNILPTFIAEVCEEGEKVHQFLRDFYPLYVDYCREAGVRNVLSRSGVEKRLESLNYIITELGGQKVIRGLAARVPTLQSRGVSEVDLRPKD